MPKGFDGTGAVRIQCSEGAYAAMALGDMPLPSDYGQVIDGRRYVPHDTRAMGADSVRYRVVWPDRSNGEGSKLRTTSFTLSGKHSNETLFVLAEHMRNQGVEFVALANKHGNTFKRSLLHGTELAYLARDRAHAVLRKSDLFVKPAPENS